MARFSTRFANDPATKFQAMETGTGQSGHWSDYLNEKESVSLERARKSQKSNENWIVGVGLITAVNLGLLLVTGGAWSAVTVASGTFSLAMLAMDRSQDIQKQGDLQATSATRAIEANKTPATGPAYAAPRQPTFRGA